MADTTCPGCAADLTPDDINIKEGVAYCRACDKVWRLAELAGVGTGRAMGSASASTGEDAEEEARADEIAAREAPGGCWLLDRGAETVVGARCRSSTGWFFLAFATFWNSITWVFVLVGISGLMHPAAPPAQMIEDAKNDPQWRQAMENGLGTGGGGGGGGDWVMLVALIPFVLVGLLTGAFGLVGVFGKIEVRLRGQKGLVTTGLGPLAWRREFSADLVRGVRIGDANSSTNGKPDKRIIIEADNDVGLGAWLTPIRRRWLAGALRAVLVPKE